MALIAAVLVTVSAPVLGYVGPGAGITMLAALWGVVVAIVLALGAVLFWPIRALLRRRKGTPAQTNHAAETPTAQVAQEKGAP
jgi:type VI protein secretion system component VasK